MDLRLFRHGDKAFGIHGPAQDGAHWRRTVVSEGRGLALGRGSILLSTTHRLCEPNLPLDDQSHGLPAGATGIRNRPGIPGPDDLSEPPGRASRSRRTGLVRPAAPSPSSSPQPELSPDSAVAPRAPAHLRAWCRQLAFRRTVGLRSGLPCPQVGVVSLLALSAPITGQRRRGGPARCHRRIRQLVPGRVGQVW
jgi:hypothetical protein